MRIPHEVSCAICHEIVTDPITLDCFHHLCAAHVANFGNRDPVACPICKASSPVPEGGLKVDTVKKIVVDYFKQQLALKEPDEESEPLRPIPVTCAYCEEQEATRRCVECHGQPLCEECATSTHSKGYFREHTFMGVRDDLPKKDKEKDDFRMVCPEHGEKLEFYCCDCRTPICSHCLIVGCHQGHERTKMDEAILTGKDTLGAWAQKMNQLKASTKALLEAFQAADEEAIKNGENQRSTVNYEMDHLREMIETKRRQLLQQSALEEKQKRVQLQVQIQQAQAVLSEIESLISRSEDLLELNCDHHFVVLVLQLIQDMKGRSSQQVDDRRRVNTAFRSLNTDQQVRVIGELELGYPQPVMQVLGGLVHQTEVVAPVAPFQGSSATTMPYVSHSNGVQHAMMAPQVVHVGHVYRQSLPPQ